MSDPEDKDFIQYKEHKREIAWRDKMLAHFRVRIEDLECENWELLQDRKWSRYAVLASCFIAGTVFCFALGSLIHHLKDL